MQGRRKVCVGAIVGLWGALLLPTAVAVAQEAVLHEGRPALRFAADEGWEVTVEVTEYNGQPAFRFPAQHIHTWRVRCQGWLYVTPERLAYDPQFSPQYSKDAFDVSRREISYSAIQNYKHEYYWVEFKLPQRMYRFGVVYRHEPDGATKSNEWQDPVPGAREEVPASFLHRAYTDYAGTLAEFTNKTTKPEGGAGGAEEAAGAAGRGATLTVEVRPGGGEFYVDDQFKGTTSSEGRLVVAELSPGEHRLRLARKGYQEWTRTVTLAAGESRTLEVQLSEAAPETALKLEDVLKLLEAGVTPARLETLVRERGVAFELTAEAERRLREAGATAELLLAIAKAKK